MMLVISTVVIAATGASYVYVPSFQSGVGTLSQNVSIILAGGRIGEVGFNGVDDGTTGGSGGENNDGSGATVVAQSAPTPPPARHFGFFHFSPFTGFGNADVGDVYRGFFGASFFRANYQTSGHIHHYQNICGAYAISSALATLLGSNESAQQIVQNAVTARLNIFDSTGRVTADGLATLAKSVGLCASHSAGFDSDQHQISTCSDDLAGVAASLAQGKVPVLLIQVDEEGNTQYGRHAHGSGHYVLPQSVGPDGVVVKDPITGETKTLNLTQLCGAWDRQGREMVTLSAPSGGVCTR
jgi:hypothetical protein